VISVGNFGPLHCSANIYSLVGIGNDLLAIIMIIIIIFYTNHKDTPVLIYENTFKVIPTSSVPN
jgi:hypothetical protein